jgi:hypothetical protein
MNAVSAPKANFIHVTTVESLAFPTIEPAIGDIGKAFNIVPTLATRVEYRGMVMTFHDIDEGGRYVQAKVDAGATLAYNHYQRVPAEIPVN